MAASARARETSGHRDNTSGHRDARHPSYAAVSVSVGRDDWTDVLDHVVNNEPIYRTHDPVARLVQDRKKQFHNGRPLELKNLPDGVTDQDIRVAFPDLDVKSITIEKSDGRYKPGARLTLDNPGLLDDWPKSRENVYVKNKEVSVCVGGSDQWLCVAKLPFSFTQHQFQALVATFGKVREAFLMVSERTGDTKGYGFVKYVSNEAAVQAKQLMDGNNVGGFVVECDWLNATHISFKQLHSKCLYVSNLPNNYRDMATFRKVFSTVKNPPYCQIAMKNGVIQNWGLVEFFNSDEAERTQEELNGYNLGGSNIRVHFCIPGVNAINIYMRVVNQPTDNNKKSLMDDAPTSSVYRQLQKLAAQNPVFAQNLQTIIQTQISSIQGGSTPAETNPEQETAPQVGAGLNHQAQAALMILLTAQNQSAAGDASLLHDPQVVDVLQTLVTQDPSRPEAKVDINSIPGLNLVFNSLGSPPPQPLPYSGPPAPIQSQWGMQKSNGSVNNDNGHRNTPETTEQPNKSPPPIIANNLNLLSNTKSLNQLLGSLTQAAPSPPPVHSQHNPTKQNPTGLPLQMPPNPTGAPLLPPPHLPVPPGHLQMPPPPRPALLGNSPSLMMMPPPVPTTMAQQQLLQAQLSAAGHLQATGQLTSTGLLTAGPALHLPQMYQPLPQLHSPFLMPTIPGMPLTGAPPAGFFIQQMSPSLTIPYSMPAALMGHPPPTIVSSSPTASLSQGLQAPIGTPYMPTLGTVQSLVSSPPTISVSTPPPNSLKRKLPIPPSPEQSPEGPYIGQHSQGIGGHYQDSYWQKKRARHQY